MKRLSLHHREKTQGKSKINYRAFYNFECECGNVVIRRSDTKADFCEEVGCTFSTREKHGYTRKNEPVYTIWEGMRSRCLSGTHASATHYKDRGIGICEEWSKFTTFRKWAYSNGFKKGLTIDRVDIDGNYEPSNCEWVTRSENTKRQIADGHAAKLAKPTGMPQKVRQYSLDGSLLAEYQSIIAASAALNKSASYLGKALKRKEIVYGYRWEKIN